MDRGTGRLVGIAAIVFPILHSITDGMEWLQGGFSALQLWLNYLAFLPMPAIMLGLLTPFSAPRLASGDS